MGARPEPVPQVVQTPSSSVSAPRGEVHDILQAIKAFELACLTRDCELLCLSKRSREEKFRKLNDLRDPKAAEFAWRMRRLTPPKEANFPKGSFQSLAWILAGDAYFEAQRTFDDSRVAIPHQEGEEFEMAQEVEEEVNCLERSFGCWGDIIGRSHLPRIVENNWEKNLSAAVVCYSSALPLSDRRALDSEDSESECTEEEDSDSEHTEDEDSESECTEEEDSDSEHTEDEDSESEGSEVAKFVFRKLGFVWHECGRRLAELGWHAKDESDKYFRKAIEAFHRVNDLPNFELALCSRIEHHRKLAEFCGTHQGPKGRKGRIESIEEARVKYEEVLDLCREAKKSLKKWGAGLHCKEVDTEEAHTYFNLGILLKEKDKIYYDKQEKPIRKGRFSADEALQKAIFLYRKLDCKPEVAYSQYLLGCVLRDRSLIENVKSDEYRVRGDIETIIDSWLKASEHYRAVRDTDMFLRIRMDHSDLYSAMKMWDQALIQMLQGCGEMVFNGSSVSEEFHQKLLPRLKTMCHAAKNLPRDIASSSSPSMADDYKFLAGIYRCALHKDYHLLYKKWNIYDRLTSGR